MVQVNLVLKHTSECRGFESQQWPWLDFLSKTSSCRMVDKTTLSSYFHSLTASAALLRIHLIILWFLAFNGPLSAGRAPDLAKYQPCLGHPICLIENPFSYILNSENSYLIDWFHISSICQVPVNATLSFY